MRRLIVALGIVAGISFVLALISKVTGVHIFGLAGFAPVSFLRFTNTCLLFALAIGVYSMLKE